MTQAPTLPISDRDGEFGTTCEPDTDLDRLLEALMEPVGRQARRLAAEAVRYAAGRRAARQPSA
jgi:hypothetical protein